MGHRQRSFRFQRGDQPAVQTAFANAAHIVEIDVVNNRLVIAPIETRGAIGRWTDDRYDLSSPPLASTPSATNWPTASSAARATRSASPPPTSAAASASRTACTGMGFSAVGRPSSDRPVKWIADRAEDFCPPPRAGTTSPADASHSTRTVPSSRSTSPPPPALAPTCPAAAPAAPPTLRRQPWAAATSSPRSSWTCAPPSPTRRPSMPSAAPASPRRTT